MLFNIADPQVLGLGWNIFWESHFLHTLNKWEKYVGVIEAVFGPGNDSLRQDFYLKLICEDKSSDY